MKHATGRIDALLVCGGKWHDFDFARLELLKLLAEDERVRVQVAADYRDVGALSPGDVLVTYTCDVRPDLEQQEALRAWVEAGGHWLALHGTNNAIDPPPELGQGPFTTPRAFPMFADTLGSQFLSHPTIEPYTVTVSPGAEEDPLVAGIGTFEVKDELYLCEYHGQIEPLLETRWTGTTRGFAEASWPDDEPRLVMYRRPLGEGCVLYLTLGHCRGHYDMVAPPHRGSWWPTVDRWAWERPEFPELLRRGLRWATQRSEGGSERVSSGGS
jgi:type 1 glutamine amidotransferase